MRVVGVDFSSSEFSFAEIFDEKVTCTTVKFRKSWEPSSVVAAYHAAREYLLTKNSQVDLLVAESPLNRMGHAWKQFVVLGALLSAAESVGVPSMSVAVGTWRKEILGSGAATKDEAEEFAEQNGVIFADHNEAESYCLARYAQSVIKLQEDAKTQEDS